MEHNKSGGGRPARRLVYQRLEEALVELRSRTGGLPTPTQAEGVWTSIWYREAHHSTAIEGNTLVLQQVEVLLAEGRAVGNKELREYMEVRGYAEAAQWIYRQALEPGEWATSGELLALTEVRHLHEVALAPAWSVAPHFNATAEERPGSFRRHEIQPFPGGMRPPSWVEIDAEMADWLGALKALRGSENVVEELARHHADFERIHPFLDGNGRAGRLVLNLLLVRLGYPPAIVSTRDRSRYLRALQRADNGDAGPLGELIARAVTDSLYRFIAPAVSGPDQLLPLVALTRPDLSVSTLRMAIGRGRLRAQKGDDGQWRSCRVWVDEYIASKYMRPS